VTTDPARRGSLGCIWNPIKAADPDCAGGARTADSTTGSKCGEAMMTTVLELRDVSKVYGAGPAEVNALRRVNMSVCAGELVAVMGPSGSGKSSLLTIAGSLEEATSGQVLVMETDLARLSSNDQARLRRRFIGYVFQDFNLLAGFTAIENVTVPLELDGTSAKAAFATGMKALEELGIAERAHHFPDELSGGERQRVAIARAVVGERRLLLADEPTGALDSANAKSVMELMLAICGRGVAGVVVTHDVQIAARADRVVYLHDGRVMEQTQTSPGPNSLLTPGAQR
jgi:putative ABC transport system ATP-binding protein